MNVSNNNTKKEAIGFAGLSSFITSSDDLSSNKKETNTRSQIQSRKEKKSSNEAESSGTRVHNIPSQKSKSENKEKKTNKPSSSKQKNNPINEPEDTGMSGFSKFLWFVVFIVVLIVWNQPDKKKTVTTYSNSNSSTNYSNPTAVSANKKSKNNRPYESKPSYGRNQVLSVSQIRYCRSEKIRLDAAESELDSYSTYDTTKFNNLVDDYNGRCGEFRYKRGNLQRAENDIKAFRSELISEGKARFSTVNTNKSYGTVPKNNYVPTTKIKVIKSKPKPKINQKVLTVQKLLNQLGYKAGIADGLMGKNTRLAIFSFQDDNDIPRSSIIDYSFLNILKNKLKYTKSSIKQNLTTPTKSKSPINYAFKNKKHQDNYKTCISAQYKSLCKKSWLTREQLRLVDIAWKKDNYKTCISAQYQSLCKKAWLTREQLRLVDIAWEKDNYKTCISAQYQSLCKKAWLTREQLRLVDIAWEKDNYKTCISAQYQSLCKKAWLTREQLRLVDIAWRKDNYKTCISGNYTSLCKKNLLNREQARQVERAGY